jgi:peptide subunit release factor 1 (eRF1)
MIDVDESKLIADLKEIYAQNDYGIVQMIYRDGNFIQETCGEAAELVEKLYKHIEALQNENRDIRQAHVSHDALAIVMADKEHDFRTYYCSVCGKREYYFNATQYAYCPHCGAHMMERSGSGE